MIAIWHALYTMTVTWYTKPQLLSILPVSLDASVLLNGFIGPLEQVRDIRILLIVND